MKLIADLKDDQYEFVGVDHERDVVRAVLINDKNEVCLEYILDNDMFGPRDYYETPGGGIKSGEDHRVALDREIAEEVGYHIEVLEELGQVDDYYNLIKRRNHNYYYLARVISKCEQALEPDEKIRINKIIWVPIDEAIRLYEGMQNVLVGRLVKQRELPILRIAKSTLQNRNK